MTLRGYILDYFSFEYIRPTIENPFWFFAIILKIFIFQNVAALVVPIFFL